MAEQQNRPVLNPVLRFTKEPRPASVTGGGKKAADIVEERLDDQRRLLASQIRTLAETVNRRPLFSGRTLLYAAMFDDSHAPSWTPTDLFQPEFGAQLVAPYKSGYLIEMMAGALASYDALIESAQDARERVDISRIKSLSFFDPLSDTRDGGLQALWQDAPSLANGRLFLVWLTPFQDPDAAQALINHFASLRGTVYEMPPSTPAPSRDSLPTSTRREFGDLESDRLGQTMREYRQKQRARTTLVVPSLQALSNIVASGSVFRIEPMRLLTTTSPGEGTEPGRPLPANLADMPIVGVVDGGLTANSYLDAQAWRASPFVPDAHADTRHGNQIASLVVQGHDWNNNLSLPPLYCRLGTVQAIAKRGSPFPSDTQQFIAYLESVVAANPGTKVWNLSFNEMRDCDVDTVSYLGHQLAIIARRHNVLFVNSVGNKPGLRLQPPADCEAALTIGGRLHNTDGLPGDPCPVSHAGPGPSCMLKPDVSHFSKVRAIGGVMIHGSSFSTALTSPLAAHTMARLRHPSPDLVKALLLHNTDRDSYDPNLGFGTPSCISLPWECRPGLVTLQWRASLRPKAKYYWEMPIPPSLRKTGKIKGMGVLTAVLNPHPFVSDYAGPNYFGARLETSLQRQLGINRKTGKPEFPPLLGSLKTSEMPELDARAEEHKWCPVRQHKAEWRRGVSFEGDTLRVYARTYTRDPYLYALDDIDESFSLDAVFVLTLGTGDESDDIYGELREELGHFVETSILESDIELDFD